MPVKNSGLSKAVRRWFRGFLIAGIVVSILAGLHWWFGPVRPLLFSTSDIREYYSDAGFKGDFSRLIRATCSSETFHSYAKQQGLQAVSGGRLPDGCPGWQAGGEDWWSPPRDYTGAYYTFKQGGNRSILAYRDGFLYYDISAW
jgi:hypothetical protein